MAALTNNGRITMRRSDDLSDDLSGPDWQRVRNAQLRGDAPVPIEPPLSDDLPPEAWHGVRARQAAAGAPSPSATASAPATSAFNVDRDFLAKQEGARRDMYVPTDKAGNVKGQSGPTIGVGVDLGGKDARYLGSLGLSPDLVARLTPYLGKQRQEALQFVAAHPLVLSEADYNALNAAVQDRELGKLAARFDADSQVGPFAKLPRDTQTAIGSLYFQYGADAPAKAAPQFWRQITTGDWEGAYRNLRKFGDAYQPRRDREADRLLYDIVSANQPRAKQ